jgi:hypothetical protein
MSGLVITFGTDGTGHALYDERIDLSAIGTLECTRASIIEWDRHDQLWVVRHPVSGARMFSHKSREQCLEWEHAHFNEW